MPSIPARFPALSARAGGAFFALLVLCAAGCQAPVPASEWEQAQARHAKALRAAGRFKA